MSKPKKGGPAGRGSQQRGPKRDDKRGPKRDEKRGLKRDDKRGPKRDDKRGPKRDDKRGPRRPGDERRAQRRPPLPGQRPVAPRPERRQFPAVPALPAAPARPGEWLFTTRPGAEDDLVDELYFTDAESAPRRAGPSLVAAARRPEFHRQPLELAFARQGFAVAQVLAPEPEALARAALDALARTSTRPRPWVLDVWVPDADETNPLAARADELAKAARLAAQRPAAAGWGEALLLPERGDARAALAENGLYVQACLERDRLSVGAGWARDAVSLAPGGRLRVHVSEAAPSRAAMKLVEALTWLDRSPEPGDVCVDLGAAPGGWTWALLERRAHVVAIDPGALAPHLRGKKGLEHLRTDAFRFEPQIAADWLFCDMAFRPLEVAGLLAKWARRRWARFLIANLKLPMRKKAEMLFRVRDILTDGGWTNLRVRQLYHDREEITVAAICT